MIFLCCFMVLGCFFSFFHGFWMVFCVFSWFFGWFFPTKPSKTLLVAKNQATVGMKAFCFLKVWCRVVCYPSKNLVKKSAFEG